jgi:excisionase family DNA binding protein
MTVANLDAALDQLENIKTTMEGGTVDMKAAIFLAGKCERQVRRDIASGKLRAVRAGRTGRQLRFTRDALHEYLADRERTVEVEENEAAGAVLAAV